MLGRLKMNFSVDVTTANKKERATENTGTEVGYRSTTPLLKGHPSKRMNENHEAEKGNSPL